MKVLFTILSALLIGCMAKAAQINSGTFDYETHKVELSVSYSGGCSEHSFELELAEGCQETFPVGCKLDLIHTTDEPDMCDAYITQKLELDLPEGMLTDHYYSEAFIKITGADGTSTSFRLPAVHL